MPTEAEAASGFGPGCEPGGALSSDSSSAVIFQLWSFMKYVGGDVHMSSRLLSMFHALTSSSRSALCPRIFRKICLACCGFLCSASHFGLSGTIVNASNWRSPMPPATARMILHRLPLLKKYPKTCAITMPILTIICVRAPNKPFSFGGATSEM